MNGLYYVYSATDYKIPKLTFLFIGCLHIECASALVYIIYQNDPQLSPIILITINWLSRDYLKSHRLPKWALKSLFLEK